MLLKPISLDRDTPQICLFINKQINPQSQIIKYYTRDLSMLTLQTGEDQIYIYNIYNSSPSSNSNIEFSQLTLPVLQEMLANSYKKEYLVIGGFNLYYPLQFWLGYAHIQNQCRTEAISSAARRPQRFRHYLY